MVSSIYVEGAFKFGDAVENSRSSMRRREIVEVESRKRVEFFAGFCQKLYFNEGGIVLKGLWLEKSRIA